MPDELLELFTELVVPEKTRKDLFPDQEPEDPLDTPSGAVILYPRIIGGEAEDLVVSKVTYTFYEHTIAQSAGKGIPATIVIDRKCTIEKIFIQVETAPGGGNTITIDINKNGTTIFTTQGGRPSITGTSTTDESSTPNIVNLVKNDKLTMDIDVHDGAAAQLSVYVRCK